MTSKRQEQLKKAQDKFNLTHVQKTIYLTNEQNDMLERSSYKLKEIFMYGFSRTVEREVYGKQRSNNSNAMGVF